MIKTKNCAICGNEFSPTRANAIYCCKECARIGGKQIVREREKRERQEDRNYLQKTKQKKPPKNSLEDIAARARAAGMTYGKYVAMLYVQEMQKGKR